VSQYRVLHLERGSCRAARDHADQPTHEHVHEEEDHAAPILRTPSKAQIRVSDPYRPVAVEGYRDRGEAHVGAVRLSC
jgi:hypothetical protein